jgi:hypothetical protein
MGKRETEYPHTISFRVADEAWLGIQNEIQGSTLTPHEWCRQAALDRLTSEHGLSKSDRILFEHFVRAQYLVTQGFQLLAEDNLTAAEWKRFRAIATEQSSELADTALGMYARRRSQKP